MCLSSWFISGHFFKYLWFYRYILPSLLCVIIKVLYVTKGLIWQGLINAMCYMCTVQYMTVHSTTVINNYQFLPHTHHCIYRVFMQCSVYKYEYSSTHSLHCFVGEFALWLFWYWCIFSPRASRSSSLKVVVVVVVLLLFLFFLLL